MTKTVKPFEEIGQRLKWRRLMTELDQEQFALKAKLKRSQYGNWESGTTRLSLDGALALRETWGLSLDFLYEGIVDALPMNLRKELEDNPLETHSK